MYPMKKVKSASANASTDCLSAHCDAICLLTSRSPYKLPWNSARTYCTGYRRAGAQGARMFRVSSVPRPGRDVFADLIRPSEPPWGIRICRVGSVASHTG
jgi:hypothetical protein